MKPTLLLTTFSALVAALPAPNLPYPSSLLFPTTLSTSVLPSPSTPGGGGGSGVMVDNMAPGGGGLPGNGMGAENKARSLASIDGEKDVRTLGKDFGDKGKDGGSWLEKGFAGDIEGKKDDKKDDDDEDKKDDDKKKEDDNDDKKDEDKKKPEGDSTFDMNRPDNKDEKKADDKKKPEGDSTFDMNRPDNKTTPNLPSGNDKPASIDKPTPEINNSNTFFDPAAEKEAEELALALDAANDKVAEDESAETVSDDLKKPVEKRGGCKKYKDAPCKPCQSSYDTFLDCLCNHQSADSCLKDKQRNYDLCANTACHAPGTPPNTVNEQTKRDNMVAVKREEERNPVAERMERRIARKQQEMRRDAIALEKEEMEKRGPIKGCKRTEAQCKPCQESWDRYMDCICSGKGLYTCFQLVQRDYNSCSNKACNTTLLTTLLTSGARKREFVTEPITEITAEKKEEERRKSTADFAAGFALLKPRQQHYYGCQSYTKSPCEPCQDRWEFCESCHCLARDDCDTICAQSWGVCQNKMCPNPKLDIKLTRPHHVPSKRDNDALAPTEEEETLKKRGECGKANPCKQRCARQWQSYQKCICSNPNKSMCSKIKLQGYSACATQFGCGT